MNDENVVLEYKKSLVQLKEGIISLSSMLNKSNRGRVIFWYRTKQKSIPIYDFKKNISRYF